MKAKILSLVGAALLSACSSGNDSDNGQVPPNAADMNAAAAAPDNAATPGNQAAAAAPAAPGFNPATAPVAAEPKLGAWPYFSLIDGYEPLSLKNKPGDSARQYNRDAAFDHYDFYDGFKLIPVEGRLYTTRADGKGASFFQVKKTYEKLVRDLGGVTVFEGSGQQMEDAKLTFPEGRHRGYFLKYDTMGVYMVRTPTREIWVEVYQPWDTKADNYWLTVVEKKTLEMKAKLLDAEQMKSALDANGRVALYINFDTDKTIIKPESQPIVAQIVKLLEDNPALKLTVEGHTDNVGDAARNLTLSNGRANSVVGALMAQGISLDRLAPKGFGQTKPIGDNATDEGRTKNRRVELVKR